MRCPTGPVFAPFGATPWQANRLSSLTTPGAAAGFSSLAAVVTAYPNGISSPAPNQPETCKPTGYPLAPPSSFYKSYKSYKSYASATPPQHAYRRCHQVALHTLAAHLRPSHTRLRQATPGVYRGAPTCQTGQTQAPHHRNMHTPLP